MASAKKPAPEKKQKNIGLVSKSLSFSTLRGVKNKVEKHKVHIK